MKKFTTSLLLFLLLAGSLLFISLDKESVSESEKRELANWPGFSIEAYGSGNYFEGISNYINDHFPWRSEMVEWAQSIRYYLGFHLADEERLIVVDAPSETIQSMAADSVQRLYDDDFRAAYSGGMLVIDGKVYPQGAGSSAMGGAFAKMLNEYATHLAGACTVYSCVAPLSSAFIPVQKYAHYNTANKNTLNSIRASLIPPARFCDVFGSMDSHFGELMYFGTDHHWNARGAYYAYTAFCEAAGMNPVPLDSMKYVRKKPFLGSLYDLTKDPVVAKNPDTLELFIPDVETQAVRYGALGFDRAQPTKVFGSANSYMAFLSGDAPLIKITTNVTNGRRAVVVKNSMGNALAVYLVSHYEEIWVMDFRYSGHNLLDLIAERKINDLIFGMGLYGAMSHGTISMMRNLGKSHLPAFTFEKSMSSEIDSLKMNTQRKDSLRSIISYTDSLKSQK